VAEAGFGLLLGAALSDAKLHAKELRQDEVFAGAGKGFEGIREMDLAEGPDAGSGVKRGRDEGGQVLALQLLERLPDKPAEHSRGKALSGAVDRDNALQMEGVRRFFFENFKLGLFKNNLSAAPFWFAVHHEADPCGDDFFNPIQVVPAHGNLTG